MGFNDENNISHAPLRRLKYCKLSALNVLDSPQPGRKENAECFRLYSHKDKNYIAIEDGTIDLLKKISTCRSNWAYARNNTEINLKI